VTTGRKQTKKPRYKWEKTKPEDFRGGENTRQGITANKKMKIKYRQTLEKLRVTQGEKQTTSDGTSRDREKQDVREGDMTDSKRGGGKNLKNSNDTLIKKICTRIKNLTPTAHEIFPYVQLHIGYQAL
jgi:hypothetical protein